MYKDPLLQVLEGTKNLMTKNAPEYLHSPCVISTKLESEDQATGFLAIGRGFLLEMDPTFKKLTTSQKDQGFAHLLSYLQSPLCPLQPPWNKG